MGGRAGGRFQTIESLGTQREDTTATSASEQGLGNKYVAVVNPNSFGGKKLQL